MTLFHRTGNSKNCICSKLRKEITTPGLQKNGEIKNWNKYVFKRFMTWIFHYIFSSFKNVNFRNLAYSSSQTENGHSVLKSDYKQV